jgi:hypothetical protein
MKDLIYFFGAILAVLLVVGVLNFMVDPTGNRHYLRDWSLKTGDVYLGNNIDERLLKKQMLSADTDSSIFILGASRVMLWGSNFFPNEKVLNLGVTNGSSDDYLYFLEHLAGRTNIDRVIIDLGPWTFPKDPSRDQYKVFYQKTWRDHWNAFKDLFTYAILRESFYTITKNQSVGRIMPASASEAEQQFGYFWDGRRHYTRETLSTSPDIVARDVLKWSQAERIPDLETGVDDGKLENFCKVLNDFREQTHAKIELVSLPLNPIAVRSIRDRRLGYTVESLEKNVNEKVAKSCKIPVQDFENLCPEIEFMDGLHPRESCLTRIMNHLAKN